MKVDVLFHFILQEVCLGIILHLDCRCTEKKKQSVHRPPARAHRPSYVNVIALFTQPVIKWGSRKQGDK